MANPYAPPGERPAPERPAPPPSDSQPPASGARPPVPPTPKASRPAPDPARTKEAGRWLGRFALLVLASLIANGLPLPWQAGALAFSLPALVVGVLALRAVVRAGLRRLPTVMLGVGLTMTVFMVIGQIGLLALWPVQQDLQECRSRALTLSATEQCQRDFEERISELTRLTNPSS